MNAGAGNPPIVSISQAKQKAERYIRVQKRKRTRKRLTIIEETDEEDVNADYEEQESEDSGNWVIETTKCAKNRKGQSRTTRAAAKVNLTSQKGHFLDTNQDRKAALDIRAAGEALLLGAIGHPFLLTLPATTNASSDMQGLSALLEAASEVEGSVRDSKTPFTSVPDSETEEGEDAQPHSPLFFGDDIDLIPDRPLIDELQQQREDEKFDGVASKILRFQSMNAKASAVQSGRKSAVVRVSKESRMSRPVKIRVPRQFQRRQS